MIPKIDEITSKLEKLQDRQEKVLHTSKEVIKTSGRLITALHANDIPKQKRLSKELSKQISDLRKIEKGYEYNAEQAHQEYVEAMAFGSMLKKGKLPSNAELGEEVVPYMLGIMDVVGELKREAFEELRRNRPKKAEQYYDAMQKIYDSTLHMKFANSIMPGFRKKQDVARIQIEGTGSEILHYRR